MRTLWQRTVGARSQAGSVHQQYFPTWQHNTHQPDEHFSLPTSITDLSLFHLFSNSLLPQEIPAHMRLTFPVLKSVSKVFLSIYIYISLPVYCYYSTFTAAKGGLSALFTVKEVIEGDLGRFR